jgi:hypothetical protein
MSRAKVRVDPSLGQLELVPEELVVNLVMELNLGHLHKGSQRRFLVLAVSPSRPVLKIEYITK